MLEGLYVKGAMSEGLYVNRVVLEGLRYFKSPAALIDLCSNTC